MTVSPLNAQVAALGEPMPDLAHRIGTVDRFQGQEAAVVVYSMTTSSPKDAPRGMGFLYDRQSVQCCQLAGQGFVCCYWQLGVVSATMSSVIEVRPVFDQISERDSEA